MKYKGLAQRHFVQNPKFQFFSLSPHDERFILVFLYTLIMYMYQGIISFTPPSITGTVTQVFPVKTYFVVRSKQNNVNLKFNSLIFIHIIIMLCSGNHGLEQ